MDNFPAMHDDELTAPQDQDEPVREIQNNGKGPSDVELQADGELGLPQNPIVNLMDTIILGGERVLYAGEVVPNTKTPMEEVMQDTKMDLSILGFG